MFCSMLGYGREQSGRTRAEMLSAVPFSGCDRARHIFSKAGCSLSLPTNRSRVMIRLAGVCVLFFLCGCGTYYNISVDSLRNSELPAQAHTFFLTPGKGAASEDPLLFQEVATRIRPAFTAQGYTVVDTLAEAQGVVQISYWEEEPQVRLENTTERRSVPVSVRDRHKTRIAYVYVDEPVVKAYTVYTTRLLVEAFALSPKGKAHERLWRTIVVSSGSTGGFRTQFPTMLPALSLTLGTRTHGDKRFEVFVKEGGEMSMDEL